jgi:hypothetical protein
VYIQTIAPPVAGESFRFSVGGGAGPKHIELMVGDQSLLELDSEDLLCQANAVIPPSTEGTILSICATDSTGDRKSLEYTISETNPGPHSMLARAGRL